MRQRQHWNQRLYFLLYWLLSCEGWSYQMSLDDVDFDALISHIRKHHTTGYVSWAAIDKALRAQNQRKGINPIEIKEILVDLGVAYKIRKYAGICLKWTNKGQTLFQGSN